jgi:hypothetical protein
VRWGWPIRQAAASITVILAVVVMVQAARFTYDVGGSFWSVLNGLSIGPYLALAGGLVLLLAPIPRRIEEPAAAETVPKPVAQARAVPDEVPAVVADDSRTPGIEADAPAGGGPSPGTEGAAEAEEAAEEAQRPDGGEGDGDADEEP